MNKNQFLYELENNLSLIPQDEKLEVISYYEDLILGDIENGNSEEDAVLKLGSIDEIVSRILDVYAIDGLDDFNDGKAFEKIGISQSFGNKVFKVEATNINNLSISTNSSNLIIEQNNSPSANIEISHFNSILSKIDLVKQGDTLYITEKSRRFYGYFIHNIIALLIALTSGIIIYNAFSSLKIWHIILIIFGIFGLLQVINLLVCIWLNVDKMKILIPSKKEFGLAYNGKFGNLKVLNSNFNYVNAKISSGNIKFINTKSKTYYMKAASGTIKLLADELDNPIKTNDITLLTSSGSIKLVNYITDNVIARCKSGNIKCKKVTCESLNISANSGSIKGIEINSKEINSSAKSGSIKYKELVCNKELNLSVTSGSIKTVNAEIFCSNAKANSGSIYFKKVIGYRKEYNLDLHSRSGMVKVKELLNSSSDFSDIKENIICNKNIKANVNSGSIKVTFLK